MDELITIRKEQAVTSSLQVAESFGKRHDNVIQAIEKLESNLLKIKDVEKSGAEFMKTSYTDSKGEVRPAYYLNEDAFSLLVMGFTGDKALLWKVRYSNAFKAMEKLLTEKRTPTWQETRKQGKLTRKSETDIIKELVEYAKSQGSTHSDKLYMIYTRLANQTVGITDRENATTQQLNALSSVEGIILITIRNGMAAGMNYKDIYQANKQQLKLYSEVSYLSEILGLEGA